jgi:isoleucyl-tRNA synthetase
MIKHIRISLQNDLILDKTGQKMSKHVGNIVDRLKLWKSGDDILR